MRSPSNRWKAYERKVAGALGTTRIPVGLRSRDGADPGDIWLPGWHVEVRDRSRPLPLHWWQEVQAKARESGTRPLLVFRAPGHARGALALLLWRDLAEVMKIAQEPGGDPAEAAGHPTAPQPTAVRGRVRADGPEAGGTSGATARDEDR